MNIAIRVFLLFHLKKQGDVSLYYDFTQSYGQSYLRFARLLNEYRTLIYIYIYIYYEEA